MNVEIWSDVVCPWCYIGKAKLDRAFAARPGHKFEVEWHPFQLNPEMPPEGMDRRDYLEAKFGGRAGAIEVYTSIANAAEAAGLTVNFEKIGRTPNTVDAHRLIHWAGIEARQLLVVDLLFKAYFVEGRDIGSHEVLADIADMAEMDAALITRLLASDADIADIRARDAHSRDMGISAVPTFVVANQHAVPGAQPTDLWVKVISDIIAQIGDKS